MAVNICTHSANNTLRLLVELISCNVGKINVSYVSTCIPLPKKQAPEVLGPSEPAVLCVQENQALAAFFSAIALFISSSLASVRGYL